MDDQPGTAVEELALRAWIDREPITRGLVQLLGETFGRCQILIVGGALRDRLSAKQPKDIDVVVDVASSDVIRSKPLPDLHENYFGGLTFSFAGYSIDIWPLVETYHIQQFALPATVGNLLAGAPFNLDRIAFDVMTQVLHDGGCLRGLARREISYMPRHPYLEHIQAARCVLVQRKTGFVHDLSAQRLLAAASAALRGDDRCLREVHDFLFQAKGLDEAARADVIDEIDAYRPLTA